MLIRVVDLETTGFTPPEAAVCEIGWSDITSTYRVTAPTAVYVDPGHPIPPQTSAVHHIVDEDVVGAPSWTEAVSTLLVADEPITALAAHNARFEQQFLTDDLTGGLPWVCTYKCALRLWPEAPAHNNGTLRYWRRPADLDRQTALLSHRAGPDAYVTAFLLREMLTLAPLGDLIRWSSQPALLVTCQFGKHRGVPWSEVPLDYLTWASRQDMDEDVLFTVRRELARRSDRPGAR